MSASLLDRPAVRRVQEALRAAGSAAAVQALADTARSADDAARALGCPLGAIVKSLIFRSGDQALLALVAGDRRLAPGRFAAVLKLSGPVQRADADFVRDRTGFAIGGVPPVGHSHRLPVAVDASLARFATIYAAAGHPHCVFATTPAELCRLAGTELTEITEAQ